MILFYPTNQAIKTILMQDFFSLMFKLTAYYRIISIFRRALQTFSCHTINLFLQLFNQLFVQINRGL